ncbi:MAG TPA: ATP-binding cassette domain-containing protein [Nocardioides sp.]|uniref:ABC transporter ATP-binding protein n=1 Tax=uncultured Nocardioides sp. TaxID=198441 RepID=UPI0026135973|nr:ATP-binding cassette domain-containing protein [uncultured Nocardioides sp.]HRD61226.1 ATP-binding cassette domain-containing protein [Nocardioides sp.]HRI97216.1 ATP-binding cassette domain-containing protein [Nocardioides sp.]HRK44518.1 ATP-binding cassette domain-containing protein [Nocardioides sp.]
MPPSAIEPETPALLSVHELGASRGRTPVLSGISLRFGPGLHGLLGVNGAGKTTALLTMAGVLPPDSGEVRVGGHDPYARTSRVAALQQIALIPQELEVPRHLRLREYLSYVAALRSVPRAERAAAVTRAAQAVSLEERLDQKLSTLSGGMIRRALIAQALLADASVLLFDESTSGLDPTQRSDVRRVIQRLAETRCCLLASHIIEDIQYLAQRVVVLHCGQVVFDGTPEELEAGAEDEPSGRGSRMERAFVGLTSTADVP